MIGLLKTCALWMVFILAFAMAPARLALAQAIFYKYVDKNGTVHFTDHLEVIPEEYRGQIKILKEPAYPPTQSTPAREEARSTRVGEESEKPEESRLRQKKAEEEKLKARQAKEKRIAELQAQIQAKQEEQRGLRTTWMVYDRVKLNQLNGEIAALEEQIQSLQKEIAGE